MSALFVRNDPRYSYHVAQLNEEEYVLQQKITTNNNAIRNDLLGVGTIYTLMQDATRDVAQQTGRRQHYWANLDDGFSEPARFTSLEAVREFIEGLFLRTVASIEWAQSGEVSVRPTI